MTLRVDRLDHLVLNVRDVERAAKVVRTRSSHWEVPDISEYRSARAVAAFVGLSSREHQSGNLRGRTRLAKTGNARLRRMLYFPAMSATRHNPVLNALFVRLSK